MPGGAANCATGGVGEARFGVCASGASAGLVMDAEVSKGALIEVV